MTDKTWKGWLAWVSDLPSRYEGVDDLEASQRLGVRCDLLRLVDLFDFAQKKSDIEITELNEKIKNPGSHVRKC